MPVSSWSPGRIEVIRTFVRQALSEQQARGVLGGRKNPAWAGFEHEPDGG